MEVNRGLLGSLFGNGCEQSIPLMGVPLPFGGFRWYFVCPCGKRVVNLYQPGAWGEFACRYCHRLVYASQRDQLEALLHRARVIRTRLGGPTRAGPPLPDKPKGMHGRTYVRECHKIIRLELAAQDLFDAFRVQFRESMERTLDRINALRQE